MRHSILFLILIAVMAFPTLGSQAQDTGLVALSGTIRNSASDSIVLLDINYDRVAVLPLQNDSIFSAVLRIPEGFYSLKTSGESTNIYLKPGDSLSLFIDTDQFDESIRYRETGSAANNYLAAKFLLEESYIYLNYYGYYAKLDEKDFLHLTDSLYQVQMDFLNTYPGPDKHFRTVMARSILFEKLTKYADYEQMNRFVTGNMDFKVSSGFPDAFRNINLANDTLLLSPGYRNFAMNYLRTVTSKQNGSGDYTLRLAKNIIRKTGSDRIREELLYYTGKWHLDYTNEPDSVYRLIAPYITNQKHLAVVRTKYDEIKRLSKGAPAPGFVAEDMNGNTVTFDQLKGQLIYIDVWATWCMPCIKEIPHLKALQKQFEGKPVRFVSICIDDKRERWKKMVTDEELDGIQLFADNTKSRFKERYSIQGVPTFIIIDKDGKIIDRKAKRPSNPELIEELKQHLQ